MGEVHGDQRRVLQAGVLAAALAAASCGDEHGPGRTSELNPTSLRQALQTCRAQLPTKDRRRVRAEPGASARRLYALNRRCTRLVVRRQRTAALRRLGFGARERAAVRRIVADDPRLAELLGGRKRVFDRIVPWTAPGGGKLEGGVADLTVSPPLRHVRARLPLRCLARQGAGEIDVEARYLIVSADRLHAFAELDSGRVRTIRVLPPARIVPLPGGTAGRCRPSRD